MNFQSIFVLFILCELFELFYVQRGDTFSRYIANLLFLYRRGIVNFLCLHPSFYIAVLASMAFNIYSVLAISIITFKALDIALKLVLLQKIEKQRELGVFKSVIENDANISFFLKMGICLFYIVVFYITFSLHT